MLKGHLGEGTELQTQIIQQQLEEGNKNETLYNRRR